MTEQDVPNEERFVTNKLDQLERQVERGNLFAHTALSSNADRIEEVESFLYGLVEILITKGTIAPDDMFKAASKIREEMDKNGEAVEPGIALRVDGDEEPARDQFIPVNCAERIHICQAVCCRLNFALSVHEVEQRVVKWDLGRPYYIRQESNGYCTHNDPKQKGCQVYKNRPSICRMYSCANDERIWKDFEKMELNEEWIRENLNESRPKLVKALMVHEEDLLINVVEKEKW
jgi:Fe-S-cluster containining protein